MSEIKKQSLLELGLSLGFKIADENDPIYQMGWVMATPVGRKLDCLAQLEGDEHDCEE